LEDIDVIIRITCQELYDNLRDNHSIFSDFKSQKCLRKLNKINKNNDYRCTEIIRDEIGLVYKNYMVFCKRNDYDDNAGIIEEIYNMYINLCIQQEQCLIGNGDHSKYNEYKNIEGYIRTLESTYGGQTEKYLSKLSNKNLGPQRQLIKNLCKDKSKIISEKKRIVCDLLKDKLNNWNSRFKKEKSIRIVYDSECAEYKICKIEHGECVSKRKIRFKTNFSNIEDLQESAIKKLRQLNFGIDIKRELKLNKTNTKYIDPFILMFFCQDNYLDYAKIYLRSVSGNSNYKKEQLPFSIKYNINVDYKKGKMTPIRNEIMAIIAERSSITVANIKNYKKINDFKVKKVS